MRSFASACLLFAACGPVLLFGDEALDDAPAASQRHLDAGSTDSGSAAVGGASSAGTRADNTPRVLVAIKPTDCRCFELTASGTGGVPPYLYQWNDGLQGAQRRVCADQKTLDLSVVVQDAASVRSSAYSTRLEPEADASCPTPPEPRAKLCIMNPSFEGTPAANLGLPGTFDAPPWSACTDDGTTANLPSIGNASVAQTTGVPAPTDGNTFVALGEGIQVSQKLCESVQGGTKLSLQFDVARLNLTTQETEAAFIEIRGGVAADCSPRQLLWASGPLEVGWKRMCVELKPTEFMDQITLRAGSDNTQLTPAVVLVDKLVPVDACP